MGSSDATAPHQGPRERPFADPRINIGSQVWLTKARKATTKNGRGPAHRAGLGPLHRLLGDVGWSRGADETSRKAAAGELADRRTEQADAVVTEAAGGIQRLV
ncbi:hypothetical protein GCM10018791_59950 [Streptomyces zaomyceticus]|nr:hypothetical protein GCM10018791_59950 [Streptomyces zaomyceticus]